MRRILFFILAPQVPIRARKVSYLTSIIFENLEIFRNYETLTITRNITPTASMTRRRIFNVLKLDKSLTVWFEKRNQIATDNIAQLYKGLIYR